MKEERRKDYPEIKTNIALMKQDIEYVKDHLILLNGVTKKIEIIPSLHHEIEEHIEADYKFYDKVDKILSFQNKVMGALIIISFLVPLIVSIIKH